MAKQKMARYSKKTSRTQRKRNVVKRARKVKQSGWMDDAKAMASKYGTMASQKAKEYGAMASQKMNEMRGTKSEEPAMTAEPAPMEQSKPRRIRRTRRTMKRSMRK